MNETILVVDDNVINRRLLSGILSREGYLTTEAEDGPQALRVMKKKHFDAAMLDIMMPGMDGYEVYEKMRKGAGSNCMPVLFLSALSAAENKVRGMALGADDYITKPFDKEEVLARLRSHLDRNCYRETLVKEKRYLEVAADRREEDINSAVNLQQSLLTSTKTLESCFLMEARRYPEMSLSSEMHLALKLNRSEFFFALFDVGGVGFSGAMAAVALARLLHGRPGGILRPKLKDQPGYGIARPAQIIKALAKEFPMQGMEYPASINVIMFNSRSRELRYANLGGACPLLLKANGPMEWLRGELPPTGTTFDCGFRQGEFSMNKGDILFFATDGVYHASNKKGEPFGKLGMVDEIRAEKKNGLTSLINAVDRTVSQWSLLSPSPQERTMVGLKFKG